MTNRAGGVNLRSMTKESGPLQHVIKDIISIAEEIMKVGEDLTAIEEPGPGGARNLREVHITEGGISIPLMDDDQDLIFVANGEFSPVEIVFPENPTHKQVIRLMFVPSVASVALTSPNVDVSIFGEITSTPRFASYAWMYVEDDDGGMFWQPYSQTHSASDWTTIVDVAFTDQITAQDTAFQFTPQDAKKYEFEGVFFMRATDTDKKPRLGLAWPTGGVGDGVATIRQPTSSSTEAYVTGNAAAPLLIPGDSFPDDTGGAYMASIKGVLVMAFSGAAGALRVQLCGSDGGFEGETVSLETGSYFRYRELVAE